MFLCVSLYCSVCCLLLVYMLFYCILLYYTGLYVAIYFILFYSVFLFLVFPCLSLYFIVSILFCIIFYCVPLYVLYAIVLYLILFACCIGLSAWLGSICTYLHSSVELCSNKLRFILHEPYDLSWPLSGRSLGQNMYYCASSIYSFKRKKQIHNVIKFSFIFGLTDL